VEIWEDEQRNICKMGYCSCEKDLEG